MDNNIFTPNFNEDKQDKLSRTLRVVASVFFIITIGLLPIFFVPSVYTALGFTKTFFVIVGMLGVLVFLGLYALRVGLIRFHLPLSLTLFWLFVLVALASALLSGDRLDSLYGNVLETQTTAFLLLMGMIMTLSLFFGKSKAVLSRLLFLLYASSALLLWVHVLRLFLGPDFLAFSMFTSATNSYLGSFNDLAVFSGLLVITSLFLLHNIKTKAIKALVFLAIVPALLMMTVVNFYIIWIIVGLFSIFVLLYLLTRDTWFGNGDRSSISGSSKLTLILAGVISALSLTFVVAGDTLGSFVADSTKVSYLEVRPSVGATFDIISSVYAEDALLGTGPNRFADAWREHKDPIINQTEFWGTDFTSGSGFVPTLFVTVGATGGMLIVIFLLSFLYTGYRVLFSGKVKDTNYLIGIIAYVAAVYLWIVSVIYVPGSVVMILVALATGIAFSVYSKTVAKPNIDINVTRNRRYGIPLVIVVLLVTGLSVLGTYTVGKQYLAQSVYAGTLVATQGEPNLSELDQRLIKSYELFPQDVFVAERAKLRLFEINKLLGLQEPKPEERKRFQEALVEGVTFSERAIALDQTNPLNHALLLSFYSMVNEPDSAEIVSRKEEALQQLSSLDPTNPSYYVLFAQLTAEFEDFTSAREYLNKAISLKSNYTSALYMLSQLDIREGNTESAIEITKSIIQIDPYNPTRYFQLGLLLASNNQLEEATKALEQAVIYDNGYANARYFLALTYLDLDRQEEALFQLKTVKTTNPDNQELTQLIKDIESGNFAKPEAGFVAPVDNADSVEQEGNVTTSTKVPETDLVSPLNQGTVDAEENDEATGSSTDTMIEGEDVSTESENRE